MTTALITGAGSVANAWEPIHLAVAKVFDRRVEDVNALFAREVFVLRWLCSQWETKPSEREGIEIRLKAFKDRRSRLTKAIADELAEWETRGTIRVRSPFSEYVTPLLDAQDTLFFTTNWDTCLEAKVPVRPDDVMHLHGCRKEPNHLYLPTEITEEPFRSTAENEHASTRLGEFMARLGRARRVVLYGLSLSALDPELGVALAEAWSDTDPPEEIVVVDKDPRAVIDRIRIHLPKVACASVTVGD